MDDLGLYTNTSDRRDFFKNALTIYSSPPCQVFIAVAFFTDAEAVLELLERGCTVKLIVRLGFPTSPQALRQLLNQERLLVRFINRETFHPKLYIFSEKAALVGSSNLTRSALTSNQEINVAVPTTDPRYEELVATFVGYWNQVRPLNRDDVDAYERIFKKYEKSRQDLGRMDVEVASLANVQIGNIGRDKPKQDAADDFLDEYRTKYQAFLDAFRTVRRVYESLGKRKVAEDRLPVRLEVDSFLSWIRDTYTTGDSYSQEPLRQGANLEAKIKDTVEAWFASEYSWFDRVVNQSYPQIIATFGTQAALRSASYDDIVAALSAVHSFLARRRFFRGGHEVHVAVFRAENSLEEVKRTLSYLLYGTDDPIVRMGRCIFDPRLRLHHFARSAVQEVLGWVNNDDLPICNDRTLRSLRWLGFDVMPPGE